MGSAHHHYPLPSQTNAAIDKPHRRVPTSVHPPPRNSSQGLLALSAVLLSFRFLEALVIFPDLGLSVTTFVRMIRDSQPVLIMMAILMTGFGVAYTALLPRLSTSPEIFIRPFYLPFWQLLGGTDLDLVYDELSLDHQYFLPLIFAGYTVLASVFGLNLLIAQMTATCKRLPVDRLKTSDREPK